MERVRRAAAIGLLMWMPSCVEESVQRTDDGKPAAVLAPERPTSAPSAAPARDTAGKVLETMDSGGYTYAELGLGGEQVWFAGPETELVVGDVVRVPQGMLMTSFKSGTLHRTFDKIYFLAEWGEKSGGTAASAGGAGALPAPERATPTAVEPAEGGKTVATLYAEKATLAGQTVVVRGRVVKFNAGIMGRNWIHLQDGTGAAGTDDVTVTTEAVVAVGEVVVVRGTVAIDKDFGAGYRYSLIVEDATVDGK